ncbi:MAG: transposase [Thermaerobacter sp.]|nr:transposase [Thermaerobacter sp.]
MEAVAPGTPDPGPRSVAVHPDEAALQPRRQAQATPAWQAHYRTRSHVEHVPTQQRRHGGRQGRYWGLRKNLGQVRMAAGMYNILELSRPAVLPPSRRPSEPYA